MKRSIRITRMSWTLISMIVLICLALVGYSSYLAARPLTTHAQTQAPHTPTTALKAGTYQVKTNFSTKQTEYGTITFTALAGQSGSVSVTYPALHLSGKGMWWIDAQQHIYYTFRELFMIKKGAKSEQMDVQVEHQITDLETAKIISAGSGIVYQEDASQENMPPVAIPVARVDSINTLTPLHS